MIRKLILPKILSYSATMFGESRHMPYRSIHFRVCRQISKLEFVRIVRVQSINKHLREITVYYGKPIKKSVIFVQITVLQEL